ncbi:putative U7 snRNA-associated Sm-like protein LSm11 [Scophthalmus maximus]|uniref:Putative U7 snRNA-associated Sm-like protein LSm11 n=1 Tax=Scophthalmus maximus TaxID=52904 RepID=A0A2U9C830_SCOMX|nr:putative U7 snRNA-associated Sm-like protein LSm11 [Scophthalmus maximus]
MEEMERKGAKSESKEKPPEACSSAAAVAERGPGAEREAGDDGADTTDVCSESFDPLWALYSPSVSLPFPNVKCFNNVAAYESFLKGGRGRAKPENVEKRRRKATKGVADPERIERLRKLMVNNPVPESGEGESGGGGTPRSRRRQKPQKNVLTRMPLCKGSPLGELYRCVEERVRVKVHIRTFKGLRGVCSGFVVAFDKFWNMAMVDVDETYREPLLGEALYHEKALTISRLFEKLNLQESSGGDEPAEKHGAQEQAGEPQPVNPEASRPTSRTESMVTAKQDKVSLKAQGPGAHQKNNCQKYGRVHTRHVNQLFIRGENVILVNPQPL